MKVVVTNSKRSQFWFVLASILTAVMSSASGQGFQVRNWYIENGLPTATVTALAQTPDGYLWVGTHKGLVRFDGDSFKPVGRFDGTHIPGVTSLFTDQAGNLWIASDSGTITEFAAGTFRLRYSPKTNAEESDPKIRRFSAPAWRALNSIFALDSAGTVWALTITGDIVCFYDSNMPPISPAEKPPAGEPRGLANDKAGRVWLLAGTNACVFEAGHWKVSPSTLVLGADKLLSPAGDKGFWTSQVTSTKALAKLVQYTRDEGWDIHSLPIPSTPARPYASAFLQDREGQKWLAIRWGGVYLGDASEEWQHVAATGPLAKCTAVCLFEDRRGSIWVGTADEGLNQILHTPVQMARLPPSAMDLHVTTACATQDGAVWMGTDRGLYRRAPASSPDTELVTTFGEQSVYSVMEDKKEKTLWVATSTGLFYLRGSEFQKADTAPAVSIGLLCIFLDRDGNLWAGGPRGAFMRKAPGNKVFESLNGPPSLHICGIAQVTDGQIWVTTRSSGVWRLQNNKLVPGGEQLAPVGSMARAILADKDGGLWIGTLGNGLFRWSTNGLQRYTMADGLVDDVIIGLMVDDQDKIWMTSHNGIFACDRRQLAEYRRGQSAPLLCLHLGLDQGLPNRECTGAGQPVISKAPDGRLWAATMAGAAGFDPQSLNRSASGAEVQVETLVADGVASPVTADGFRLPASTRRFEFHYSAPELSTPKTLRFRYRLDGLDQDWVDAGSGRSASYSQLPAGEYHFRVTVGGADGIWREAKHPAALQVTPQFWQTRWFQFTAGGLTVMTLVGIVVLNERRRARRRMEVLEAQQAVEKARRRIAQDLHDELGSAITEIVQLGDLTLQPEPDPQTLRSSVKTMTRLARQLGISLDEVVWTMSSRNDTLPNLVGYICNHAQEFLRHSGIRCRLDVTKNLPHVGVNSQLRHNLFMAVKEALNNAAKHSHAREIVIRVHHEDEMLRVTVEDDGRGFDPAAQHAGEGLGNMRERLQAAGGRVEFISAANSGSKIVFILGVADASVGVPVQSPQ